MSKYLLGLSLLTISIVLVGCDDFNKPDKSARSICSDEPSLCADLNKGGWCDSSRGEVIQARWSDHQQHSVRNDYRLLTALNTYQQCVALITQIEPLKLKERKTQRTETLLAITSQIQNLEEKVKLRDDPYSLFYRWSHLSDYPARAQFLQKRTLKEMREDPLLLWAQATLYDKSNPQLSLQLMHQALMFSSQQKKLPKGLLESIVTENMRLNHYDQAYIWSLVAEQLTEVQLNLKRLDLYEQFSDEQVDQFESTAKTISKSIRKGEYRP